MGVARLVRGAWRFLRRAPRSARATVARSAGHSRLGAGLYYAALSGRFTREQRATLAGRLRFHADVEAPRDGSALLRRNAHRLEKGLLMRPRREVFALDYIGETVGAYERLVRSHAPGGNGDEVRWVHDVLCSYFEAVASHPVVDPLRARFGALPEPAAACDRKLVPYRRDVAASPPVAYEALMRLAVRRRSVRWFQQRPVPRELIDKALAVATQSPSACNRQPFVFRIFDEPELVRKVAALPGGTKGFDHNFPAIAVVVGQLRNYYDEKDRHVIYIDGGLASMSFILALETLGLSSCCINWPDIEEDERRMDEALKLEPDERPVMLIAFGYPDPEGLVAYSQKKPPSQIARYNFE